MANLVTNDKDTTLIDTCWYCLYEKKAITEANYIYETAGGWIGLCSKCVIVYRQSSPTELNIKERWVFVADEE